VNYCAINPLLPAQLARPCSGANPHGAHPFTGATVRSTGPGGIPDCQFWRWRFAGYADYQSSSDFRNTWKRIPISAFSLSGESVKNGLLDNFYHFKVVLLDFFLT
jgi:hypothetical protein